MTMAVAGAAMEGEAANPGPNWDNPDVDRLRPGRRPCQQVFLGVH